MSDIDLSAGGLSALGGRAALPRAVAAWADRAAALGGRAPETLPPPPVLFHLEASVWVECSSTQEAQWCEHGATDPQFIQHGGVSVSRRGGGGVGGSISVFLSIYYNNCNYMMKWAMVLTLAGALCCPLEEGRFAPRLVTKQPTVALTLLSDTGVGLSKATGCSLGSSK